MHDSPSRTPAQAITVERLKIAGWRPLGRARHGAVMLRHTDGRDVTVDLTGAVRSSSEQSDRRRP